MEKSIETLANEFYEKPHDEASAMRAEINDTKKEVNDKRKSIDEIKAILLQAVNKITYWVPVASRRKKSVASVSG